MSRVNRKSLCVMGLAALIALFSPPGPARAQDGVTDPPPASGPAAGDRELAAAIVRGRQLVRDGRLEEARDVLEKVVREAPSNAQARFWLGRLYMKQGRFEEGLREIEQSMALAPDNLNLKLELARAYEEAGRPERAEQAYLSILEENAGQLDARLRLGRLYMRRDLVDKAIDTFEDLAGRTKDPVKVREVNGRLIRLYERKAQRMIGRLASGEQDLPSAIEFAKKLERNRRLDDAQHVLQAVVEQDPENAQAHYWLGQVYLDRKQFGEGLAGLERSVSLAPGNVRLKNELAKAYEQAGKLEDAERTYQEVVSEAENAELRQRAARRLGLVRARRHMEADDVEAAIEEYDALLAGDPEDKQILWLKAYALNIQERIEESNKILDELLRLAPDNIQLRMQIAAIYESRGSLPRAREQYAEVLKLEPGKEIRRQALAGLGLEEGIRLAREKKFDQALQAFDRVLAVVPSEPQANLNVAKIYHRQERYEEAETAYRKVLEVLGNHVETWLALGVLYAQTDRVDDSIDALEKVVKYGWGTRRARQAQQQLAGLYKIKAQRVADALTRGEGDADAALALGKQLVRKRRLASARQVLSALVMVAPQNPQGHYWLGQTRIQLGETDRGVRDIERSVELAPDNMALQLALGGVYEQLKRWEAAEQVYVAVLDRTENEAVITETGRRLGLLRGRRFARAGDFDAALAEYDSLLDKFPGDAGLLSEQADVLLAQGRDTEAKAIFDRILEGAPEDAETRVRIAEIYRQRDHLAEAVALYKGALELEPSDHDLRLKLAGLYERLDQLEQAMQQYSQIVNSGVSGDPADRASKGLDGARRKLIERGRKLLAEEKLDEAQELFEGLLKLEPDNAQGHFWLSQVFRERGSYREEVKAIEKSLQLAPGNARLKKLLAFAYLDAAMLSDAEKALKEILEDLPYDSEVRFRLAELYDKRGEEQRARTELMELLKLQAPEEWAQKALDMLGLEDGRRLMDEGRPGRALSVFQSVLEVAPDDPGVNKAIAGAYQELGRDEEAEAAYRKTLQADPLDAQARLALADLYARTDRDDLAVQEYHRLVTEHEGSTEAGMARQKLETLLSEKADREIEAVADLAEAAGLEEQLVPVGVGMVDLGGLDGAEKIFEFLLNRVPDSAIAHYWLGKVYAERNRYADGLVLIKESTELAPEEVTYWIGLGRVYRDAAVYSRAEEAFAQAVSLDPGSSDARLELADLYERRGARARAREQYVALLQGDFDREARERALKGLGLDEGIRLAGEEQYDRALRTFERILTVVPDEPQTNLRAAQIYHRQKRYGQAEAAYRRTLAADADDPEAWLGLGLVYAETDRTTEAIEALEEVIAKGPETREARHAQRRLAGLYERRAKRVSAALARGQGDPDAAVDLGKHLVRSGRLDVARQVLTVLVEQAPDNPQGFYWLGQVHIGLGEVDRGLDEIEHSVALAPENLPLLVTLGQAYEKAGRLRDAERVYAELAERAQDEELIKDGRRRLHLVRGRRLGQSGDLESALAEYDTLVRQFPEDVTVLGERGSLLLALGRDDKADEMFGRVLEVAPENIEIRMRLARLYEKRRDTDKFLEQLRKIIEIDPRSKEAQQARQRLGYDRGVELLRRQALADAEQVFARLLTVVPEDPLTNLQLGTVYFEQRRWQAAERALKKTVEIDPDNQEAYFMLGRLYQAFQNEDRAIASYEEVIAIDRASEVARRALGELDNFYRQRAVRYQKAGELERAIGSYERAVDTNPDNVAARFNLGVLNGMLRRYDDALSQFRQVARLSPESPRGYQYMANAYVQKGEYQEAIDSYARAISLAENEKQATNHVRALIMTLSRKLMNEDRPVAALRELENLNELELGDARSHQMVAQLYAQQNDFEQAAQAFRDAIRLAPDNVILRLNLAIIYERTNEDQLALYQYREIMNVGEPGSTYVEEARRRLERVEERLRLFSSTMRYSMVFGESVIEEQDIVNTGAINSSFSSIFSYNLATRFRPRKNLLLTLDTGVNYIGNHSTQNDSIVPRVGFDARINDPKYNVNAGVEVRENKSLLLDTLSARSYRLDLGGSIPVTNPLDLLRSLGGGDEEPENGETDIERAPESPPPPEPEAENQALRAALEDVYRNLYPERKRITVPEEEEKIKRYVVKKGDTLWDIAEALLFDPFLWPEIWQENPHIENPHLIFPDDVITLFYIGERPVILIERAGERLAPPPQFVELTPEEKEQRTEQIERSVQEGMELYERGRELLLQNRLEEALNMFNLVLEIVPDDPLTNLSVGIVYHRQQEYLLAEEAFKKTLAADPSSLEARLRLGELYADMGRLDDAIAALEQVVREGGDSDIVAQADARLTDLYERKASLLLELTELEAEDLDELVALAHRLLERDAADAAHRVLDALLRRAPDNAPAHIEMARVNLRRHSPEEAVRQAEAGVALAPDNPQFRLVLARAYDEARRLQEAAAAYGEVLAMAGDETLITEARREQSIVEAALAMEAGEFSRALEIYLALLEQRPEDVQVLELAGRAYERLDEPEKAAEIYEKAIKLSPDNINLYLRLAAVYDGLDKGEAADAQLAKAVEVSRTGEERREVLDQLGLQRGIELLRDGNLEEALEVLEQVLAVVPEDPLTLLNVGVIYQRQGRHAEAEAVFQRILEDDPRNLNAMLRLGLLYAETGRVDKAITTLERVVTEGKGTAAGRLAAEELKSLEQQRLEKLMSGELEEAEPQPKSLTASLFVNDSSPRVRSIAETNGYGINLGFLYPSLKWGNWRLGYRYTVRDNEHRFGTDYAYNSHEFNLSINRPVPNIFGLFGSASNIPRLYGAVSLSKEIRNYVNPDTNALNALGRSERRQITIDSLAFSLRYRLHDKMAVVAQFTSGTNDSNLPVGFVFNPSGTPVAFQSSGLGDFSQQAFTIGLSFNF